MLATVSRKKAITFFLLLSLQILYGQKQETLAWINSNAIPLENLDATNPLTHFSKNVPSRFRDAKIFGFGEATHHGKEFFDVKAKFFKYLVENNDVRVFIIEDNYPIENIINSWISGGPGDKKSVVEAFKIAPWHCQEIVDLLEWMRHFNQGKSTEQQIRVYGMDIQVITDIHLEIRNVISKYNLSISPDLLSVIDSCAKKKVDYNSRNKWADQQLPNLKEVEKILNAAQVNRNANEQRELKAAVRALNYLIKYTQYIQHNYSQDRDLRMFENVQFIVSNLSNNGKAFIWAHNEHVNADGFGPYSTRKIYNLGQLLKRQYKDNYYTVGFDFGIGDLNGFVFNDNGFKGWKVFTITEPFRGTYAEILSKATYENYFLDLTDLSGEKTNFFKSKKKQLLLGGPGYNPKKNNLWTKKYANMYDAIIYINKISSPDYSIEN